MLRSLISRRAAFAVPVSKSVLGKQAWRGPQSQTNILKGSQTRAAQSLNISIFGLGYVGAVSAACLARQGHHVIGVDVSPAKVGMIAAGSSPIVEERLEAIIQDEVRSGRLVTTTDAAQAIAHSDLSLICVGTPSNADGSIDLRQIESVCGQIGGALRAKAAAGRPVHNVVVRSTILPGTMTNMIIPALERYSGLRVGRQLHACVNPEFLREGKGVEDFYNPPLMLIGAGDEDVAATVRAMYRGIEAPLFVTSIEIAEMVKYACNGFHALKTAFANEIGAVCKSIGVDSQHVMSIVCADTKLNLSAAYLTPGFAFGGSCLPKDLRALIDLAHAKDVDVPVLEAILPSNTLHIERVVSLISSSACERIGVVGLSFKAGTDDLRESPMVTLVKVLLSRGLKISIYDRDLSLSRIIGANKEYILNEIPNIESLMRRDLTDVLRGSDLVVLGTRTATADEIIPHLRPDQTIIDLVRLLERGTNRGNYHGICW